MKSKIRAVYILPVSALILTLVAWSPPNSENLIVGPTTGSTANALSSPSGQSGLVGLSNSIRGTSSFVVGDNNTNYNSDGTVNTANKISRSLIAGDGNVQSGDRQNCILAGTANSLNANNTLVSGYNNDIASVTSTEVRNSCAIGGNNIITSPHAYAVGYNGTISGDYGVAIGNSNTVSSTYSQALGVGLSVNQSNSTAVGRYNAAMSSGDVFVVGTGNSTTKNTALTAKSDGSLVLGSANSGSVVLAKAQGDISMGEYEN